MPRLQTYAGDGFEVTYDPATCVHAAECVRGLPEVFDARARPWIRPERATVDRIAEVVARCPSGALKVVRAAANVAAPAPAPAVDAGSGPAVTVSVTPGGPLVLSGSVVIRGADGATVFTGTKAALCRCGHSARKPFCDGSHRAARFDG